MKTVNFIIHSTDKSAINVIKSFRGKFSKYVKRKTNPIIYKNPKNITVKFREFL